MSQLSSAVYPYSSDHNTSTFTGIYSSKSPYSALSSASTLGYAQPSYGIPSPTSQDVKAGPYISRPPYAPASASDDSSRGSGLQGKLKKRSTSKSSKPAAGSLPGLDTTGDNTSGKRPSPSASAAGSPIESLRSTRSQSLSKEKLRQNLRKFTPQRSDTSTTLDLSRTAEENEAASGLALSASRLANNAESKSAMRGIHARSSSRNSTHSMGGNSIQPTAPFVHPMRQTPRVNTPITSSSLLASLDGSGEAGGTPSHRYDEQAVVNRSLAGSRSHTGPLAAIEDNSPFRLTMATSHPTSTSSPSDLPTPWSRSRRNTSLSTDTVTSPASRTSYDRGFNVFRPRAESMDPAERAASIHAARQAFAEREEAKARRYEKKEQKCAEKQARKEDRGRRVAMPQDRSTTSTSEETEKSECIAGVEYAGIRPRRSRSVPVTSGEKRTMARDKAARRPQKDLKSRYLRFLAWLKTRLLNFGSARSRSR